jgi:hypothetical protein
MKQSGLRNMTLRPVAHPHQLDVARVPAFDEAREVPLDQEARGLPA